MQPCTGPNCVTSATLGKEIPWSPVTNFSTVGSFVSILINNSMVLAGIIAFIFIIVAGFGILTAAGSGDSKKMQQAQQSLTMAVVGLLLIVFALWVIQTIGFILGIDILHPQGVN